MKKTLTTLLSITIFAGLVSSTFAKSEKKKPPRNNDAIEKMMTAAGADHFPEKMKVNKVGPIKVGDTYYHVYCGSLRKGGYRVIIFNNVPEYLGYYPTDYEPSDYEEGAVLLDSGDSDEDGNTSYFTLPIGAKGPSDKIRIDGTPVAFVKSPAASAEKEASGIGKVAKKVAPPVADNGAALEYRDWKITLKGKQRTFNAIYVSVANGKVTIKDSKMGRTATVPVSSLSADDIEYLKKITKK